MTDYHPVTKEELDQIKNDCAYPDKPYCEGCSYCDENEDITRASGVGCQFKGANILMDEVIARPDPLEVLEKWAWFTKDNLDHGYYEDTVYISEMQKFIQEYRTNPDAVIARGKEEGWLK